MARPVWVGLVLTGCMLGAQPAGAAAAADWASGITLGGRLDAGITGNPQSPGNGQNYGLLFDDKANRPLLDQLAVTLKRDVDPRSTDYDFGFRLELLYGSDARIVHALGVFDHLIHDRNQLDISEADIAVHTPWLFDGGIDLLAGLYPSPLGYEQTNPLLNQLYSHSYAFYALPYKHLGVMGTAHVTQSVDVILEIDTGSNTTIGSGDNNGRPAGIAGIAVTLGDVKILALTHIGPDDAVRDTTFGNSAERYINDLIVTYTQSPKLSFASEVVYLREEGFRAEAYGVAQNASYALTSQISVNGRAEVFRDNANFFVGNPVGSLDYTRAERGLPANFYTSQRPTTYSEFTVGLNYSPAWKPAFLKALLIRPELRYDRALAGGRPFDGGKDHGSFTVATDLALQF